MIDPIGIDMWHVAMARSRLLRRGHHRSVFVFGRKNWIFH